VSEPIQPALTAEEWAELGPAPKLTCNWDESIAAFPGGSTDRAYGMDVHDNRHAIAALALNGQKFGFTREMLRAIKTLLANHIAEDRGRDGDTWYSDELEKLVALGQDTVGRIEALLPPEKPT
jgi:hypothetical protein